MAKQPKMDGAQNRQGQDTELGEEGGWKAGVGEEQWRGGRKDQPLPLETCELTPSPQEWGRGPSKEPVPDGG